MEPIRVATGTGIGPTALAAYDAALLDAGVGDYNLLEVSSVIPVGADLAVVDTVPEVGPTGGRLTVVVAEATVPGPGRASAALGWARADDGRGVLYEAGDETDVETVRERVGRGLEAGAELRDWTIAERGVETATTTAGSSEYAAAVAVAAFGRAEPVLG